jgi:hypothetical protein
VLQLHSTLFYSAYLQALIASARCFALSALSLLPDTLSEVIDLWIYDQTKIHQQVNVEDLGDKLVLHSYMNIVLCWTRHLLLDATALANSAIFAAKPQLETSNDRNSGAEIEMSAQRPASPNCVQPDKSTPCKSAKSSALKNAATSESVSCDGCIPSAAATMTVVSCFATAAPGCTAEEPVTADE